MSEWENAKIGTLCTAIFSGGTPKTAEASYWDGDLLWLSSGETRNRHIFTTDRTITKEGVDNSSTRLALKGDIVMASAGQGNTRGQTSVVMQDMYINQSVIALRVNLKKLNNLYLFYSLSSRYEELRVKSDASSTRGSITTDMLKKMLITIPKNDSELRIQTRIASILSAYDDAIENNNRRIALLEKAARELYREWFVRFRFPGHEGVKFVNGLPEGWEVQKIKTLVKRLPFKNLYKEPDVLSIGSVIVIDQSQKECLGFHNNEPDYFASADNPIVLFGDHSCKMEFMTSPFSLAENIIPLKTNSKMPEVFLFQTILGKIETTEYKRHYTELVSKKVILPLNDLQEKYNEIVKPFYVLCQSLKTKNRNLARQRDLLLPRLMSGKLEV